MKLRHTILKYFLFLALAACTGASPGAGGGPMDGANSVGGGNYAAGPVSLPTPATLNKNLIVCENIAGPDVVCRGSAGAVPPYAKVQVSVHPAGFTSWQKKLESLFLGTAYAAGASALVNADGTGAFTATVEAAKDEVIQIQVGTSRLLLTVPDELGSVSGSTGTMKNMTVDPEGNIWFSRRAPQIEKRGFRWTSLFFSEASAAPASTQTQSGKGESNSAIFQSVNVSAFALPIERMPTAASCSTSIDTSAELQADAIVEGRCEVKRMAPNSETPEVVASFPGCVQDDIKFIRPVKVGGSSYVLVGIRSSIYVVRVDTVPGTIVKRVVFPGPVLSADNVVEYILVTIAGDSLPNEASKVYLMANQAPNPFETNCFEGGATVFNGIQSVASVDAYDNQYLVVGVYPEGYRVLTSESTPEFIFEVMPGEIYRSNYPLEAVYVDTKLAGVLEAQVWKDQYYAILSPQEKTLYLMKTYYETVGGTRVKRTAIYNFDLSAFSAPSKIRIDRENEQLAFLDQEGTRARLVILSYALGSSPTIDVTHPLIQDLGEVTPGGLARSTRRDGQVEWVVNAGGASVLRLDNAVLSRDGPPAP